MPFPTLLTLFVITSASKCNFPSIHSVSSTRLDDLVFKRPDLITLRADLIDRGSDEKRAVKMLETTVEVVSSSDPGSKVST